MTNLLPASFLGSISEGTLRTQDLLPRFIQVLEAADPQHSVVTAYAQIWDAARLLAEYMGRDFAGNAEDVLEAIGFWDSEQASWMLNDTVFDALNEVAPEGTYFGASEGDGASFGFWEYEGFDDSWPLDDNDEPSPEGVINEGGIPDNATFNPAGGPYFPEPETDPDHECVHGVELSVDCPECEALVAEPEYEPESHATLSIGQPDYLASMLSAASGISTSAVKLNYGGVLIERPCRHCDTVDVHFQGKCNTGYCQHPDCKAKGLRYTSQYNHYLHTPTDHVWTPGSYEPSLLSKYSPAFDAIVEMVRTSGMPSAFTSDLFRDYQRLTRTGIYGSEADEQIERFILAVRDTGTDMITPLTETHIAAMYMERAQVLWIWDQTYLPGLGISVIRRADAEDMLASWRRA